MFRKAMSKLPLKRVLSGIAFCSAVKLTHFNYPKLHTFAEAESKYQSQQLTVDLEGGHAELLKLYLLYDSSAPTHHEYINELDFDQIASLGLSVVLIDVTSENQQLYDS